MSSSAKMLTGLRDVMHHDTRINSNIKTVKRGIFYPSAAFPVLAFLPMAEGIHKQLANGKYYYVRRYSLQLYTKGADLKKVRKRSIQLIEITKIVLQEYTNAHNLDTAYNIMFGDTDFSGYQDVESGIVALTTQDFSVYSVEQLPDSRTREDRNLDARSDNLGERLYELIMQAKQTQYGKIGKVNSIYYPVVSPIPETTFPAIGIIPLSDTKDRYAQQLDNSLNAYQIQLYTKLSDHELNLIYLLEILDDLRALIFSTRTLTDLCWNMTLNNITFQYLVDPEVLRAYMALINITYSVFENARR